MSMPDFCQSDWVCNTAVATHSVRVGGRFSSHFHFHELWRNTLNNVFSLGFAKFWVIRKLKQFQPFAGPRKQCYGTCCTLWICTQRIKHHQKVLFRSSPSLPWCSTMQDTRFVGITQLTAESRQRTSPFSIADPTQVNEIRNYSCSPGSLHPRSCSLWFLGIPKHQKLDIQIHYMWK